MDYFWLRQDDRYLNPPRIHGFIKKYRRSDFTIENEYKIDEKNVVFVDSKIPLDYVDVIDSQVFLVNENVKRVFEMYETSVRYKTFCLLDNRNKDLKLYYAPILPVIQGDPKSIIEKEQKGDRAVFRIEELPYDGVVIRLDVAESLLRRGLYKMRIHRLPLESLHERKREVIYK